MIVPANRIDNPKYVAYGSYREGIVIYDMASKEIKQHIQTPGSENIRSIIAFDEQFIVFTTYSELCKWNWREQKLIHKQQIYECCYRRYAQLKPGENNQYYTRNVDGDFILPDLSGVDAWTINYSWLCSHGFSTTGGNRTITQCEPMLSCSLDRSARQKMIEKLPTKHAPYYDFGYKDSRGFSYMVSLEYNVLITDGDDNVIWTDDNVSKFIRQLTSVTVLDYLKSDMRVFENQLSQHLNRLDFLPMDLVRMIASYFVY